MFDMIRHPHGPDDDQNEEDYDGSEFLNNTGEGDMIFDRDKLMKSWIMMAKKLMIMMVKKLMIMMAKKMLILI